MLAYTLRGPHSLYRRYQAFLESTLTAAGFALLITLTLRAMAVYPENWVVVLGVAVGIVGVRWPLMAYVIGTAALIYPIYTINLYLAVLFIAVSALGHRFFAHYLGATTLVLATPLLAQYNLHWLTPVLGGLWWGAFGGAWIGGMGALWGKMLAGMAGMRIDWLLLAGQLPGAAAITERFQTANSLNTLLLLVEPFADNSSVMLYNLLQIVGWVLAGWFVGAMATRKWVKYHTPWSILVVTAGGGLILLATHVGLPYWLTDAVSMAALATFYDPTAPLFSLVVVIVVGTAAYTFRETLDLPVAPRRQSFWARRKKIKMQPFSLFKRSSRPNTVTNQPEQPAANNQADDLNRLRRPVRVPHQSELPEWEPPQNDSGLIMLEID